MADVRGEKANSRNEASEGVREWECEGRPHFFCGLWGVEKSYSEARSVREEKRTV